MRKQTNILGKINYQLYAFSYVDPGLDYKEQVPKAEYVIRLCFPGLECIAKNLIIHIPAWVILFLLKEQFFSEKKKLSEFVEAYQTY